MDSIWRSYGMLPNWPSSVYDLKCEIEDDLHDLISRVLKQIILEEILDETT